MDLITLIQIVFRRWYVTVPILLATIGLAAYVQSTIPPEYEARGSVLLEEPRFDPSRLPATFVNAEALVDRFDQGRVGSDRSVGDTEIVPHARDRNTVEITAIGSEPDEVGSSVEGAMDWIVDDVTTLQEEEGIASEERLRASILTPVVTAEEQPGGRYQATGLIVLRDPAAGIDNPFSAGGGTTSLLVAVATSDGGRTRINRATGPDVTFGLATTRDHGAIINITTTGPEPADVVGAFDVIREALAEDLDTRQARADVPASRRIVINDLARPLSVRDVSPPLNRAVAAIVGVGGLLAIAGAIAFESVASRRRVGDTDVMTGEAVPEPWLREWQRATPVPRGSDAHDSAGRPNLSSQAASAGREEER